MDVSLSGQEVPPEDLPDSPSDQKEVPASDMPGSAVPDSDIPENTHSNSVSDKEGMALAGIESFARHASLGATDALAKGMRSAASSIGVPENQLHWIAPAPETLEQRQEQHPNVAFASGLAGDVYGPMKLKFAGSNAVNTAIQMGLIGGGDEFSKAMLGKGDPGKVVAGHIAANAALGWLFGKGQDYVMDKATKAAEQKYGAKALNYIAGAGHSLSGKPSINSDLEAFPHMAEAGIPPDMYDPKAFVKGSKEAIPKIESAVQNAVAIKAMGVSSKWEANPQTALALSNYFGKIFAKKVTPKIAHAVGPLLLRSAANGNVQGISRAVDYGLSSAKGLNMVNGAVESIFKPGVAEVSNLAADQAKKYLDQSKEKINSTAIEKTPGSDVPPEDMPYASGGEIEALENNNALATHLPEHNVLLNAAKSRVLNYLRSAKPQQPLGGAFDIHREHPNNEKAYNDLVTLANHPLSIVKKIKDGRLTPKTVSDFKNMYPEIYDHMAQQMTQHITNHQVEGTRPENKVRQSLSLFLGTTLEKSLSPQSIMAAQMTFAPKTPMPQSKTGALQKTAQNSMTDDQAREKRATKM